MQPNSFTSYDLTEREVLEGSVLSITQKQLIQNDLSQVAEQLLALTVDPKDPRDFAQQHSFLTGQMGVLRMLLLRSNESERQLVELASSSFPSN